MHAPLAQIATRSPGDLPDELKHLPDDKRFAHRLHELEKAVRQNDGQRWLKVDIDAAVAHFYVRHNGGMLSVDTAGGRTILPCYSLQHTAKYQGLPFALHIVHLT